ncbi:hypothetical protein KIL84_001208 [Mauremys mutica]|uniref:Uncharacterized protein n=1 Tax=Mauremys mutica TaxID=74926 RepID=A0A9D3X0D9_9SAUR|nr:hypothetical protein KIL84_001208 [Mauremys mutica]
MQRSESGVAAKGDSVPNLESNSQREERNSTSNAGGQTSKPLHCCTKSFLSSQGRGCSGEVVECGLGVWKRWCPQLALDLKEWPEQGLMDSAKTYKNILTSSAEPLPSWGKSSGGSLHSSSLGQVAGQSSQSLCDPPKGAAAALTVRVGITITGEALPG